MSYTSNRTLQITEDAITDMRQQFMVMKLKLEASEQKTEKLSTLNEAIKESFDLLFEENETLKKTVQQKELRIRQLEEKLKALKFKKKGRIRLDDVD